MILVTNFVLKLKRAILKEKSKGQKQKKKLKKENKHVLETTNNGK